MLIVDGLCKRYEKRSVLKGISFSLSAGEIVALVGANGAGKSTLIRSILGLTPIQEGRIAIGVGGAEPGSMAARRVTAYVPDQPMLYNDLTAWEHLQYVAMAYGLPRGEFAPRAEELLRKLGLWADRDLDPLYMSKGMKQKLSLAAALLVSPRLLLLDEPFSGLDPLAARHLREQVLAARAGGTAVLMSTHMLDIAERTADRFLLLYGGRLVGQGTAEELRAQAGLAAAEPMDEVFAARCAEPELP